MICCRAKIVLPVATNEMSFEFLTLPVMSKVYKSVVELVPVQTFS